MNRQHQYTLTVQWTGNKGQGTSDYRAYDRSHTVGKSGTAAILCSSDVAFNGDPSRYNPEELLVAAISSCHMLWYLHLCAAAGVVVTDYTDHARGTMEETEDGGGHFTGITLYPHIIVDKESMLAKAGALHAKANKLCFIANSCNFFVQHQPTYAIKAD